ncbi:hypothetical protein [Paenibacillus oryzisoli]|uniref:hypothetical protein n=1 Tax=Paenibacillus oryzisoli TaxID=1850517 RepID=UPI0012F9210E|nr:hypothetical protein [Paenibacillus oryzisoli]
MNKMKVGIIGCGNISAAYMKNIPGYAHLELYACADILLKSMAATDPYVYLTRIRSAIR